MTWHGAGRGRAGGIFRDVQKKGDCIFDKPASNSATIADQLG